MRKHGRRLRKLQGSPQRPGAGTPGLGHSEPPVEQGKGGRGARATLWPLSGGQGEEDKPSSFSSYLSRALSHHLWVAPCPPDPSREEPHTMAGQSRAREGAARPFPVGAGLLPCSAPFWLPEWEAFRGEGRGSVSHEVTQLVLRAVGRDPGLSGTEPLCPLSPGLTHCCQEFSHRFLPRHPPRHRESPE